MIPRYTRNIHYGMFTINKVGRASLVYVQVFPFVLTDDQREHVAHSPLMRVDQCPVKACIDAEGRL